MPKKKTHSDHPDELLTTAEVCTLLKVTRGALHNYKTKGLIPAHRLGAKVRFKKSEVLAALHSIKTKRGK
ncbi:MAG: helix-turn-helix domain-containing protein [Bacteroidetes bacterium]|nr:helix-turn-helix domain-containing protein [Bacteroidota bacterium]